MGFEIGSGIGIGGVGVAPDGHASFHAPRALEFEDLHSVAGERRIRSPYSGCNGGVVGGSGQVRLYLAVPRDDIHDSRRGIECHLIHVRVPDGSRILRVIVVAAVVTGGHVENQISADRQDNTRQGAG